MIVLEVVIRMWYWWLTYSYKEDKKNGRSRASCAHHRALTVETSTQLYAYEYQCHQGDSIYNFLYIAIKSTAQKNVARKFPQRMVRKETTVSAAPEATNFSTPPLASILVLSASSYLRNQAKSSSMVGLPFWTSPRPFFGLHGYVPPFFTRSFSHTTWITNPVCTVGSHLQITLSYAATQRVAVAEQPDQKLLLCEDSWWLFFYDSVVTNVSAFSAAMEYTATRRMKRLTIDTPCWSVCLDDDKKIYILSRLVANGNMVSQWEGYRKKEKGKLVDMWMKGALVMDPSLRKLCKNMHSRMTAILAFICCTMLYLQGLTLPWQNEQLPARWLNLLTLRSIQIGYLGEKDVVDWRRGHV